jgi:hypothetical protein
MASALITNRQYTNFYTGTTTSWLIGNVGDVVELTLDLEAEIKFLSTYQTQVKITNDNEITRLTGSWYDEGFAVGQSVDVSFTITTNGTPTSFSDSGTITTLTPSLMIVNGIIFPDNVFPFQNTINSIDYEFSGLTIACDSINPFAGVEFLYGLTTNTQVGSGDLSSLIDGTVLTFKNNAIQSSIISAPINLIPFSYRSGGAILSATIKGNTVIPTNTLKKYIIKIKFVITPIYEVVDDLKNLTLPTPYKGNECITDILRINLLPEINNPNINVSVSGTQSVLKGNTGWFNENYNGGVNNYSINQLQLFNEVGVPISGISSGGKTDFTIIINQIGATSAFDYKLGFVWTPSTPSYYTDKLLGYHENVMYNGCSDSVVLNSATVAQTFTGYANEAGARMDIEFGSITLQANTVTIRGKFAPNAAFETFMEAVDVSDLNYLVWVSVGDNLAVNVTDRVSLIADFSSFTLPAVVTEQFNVTNSFLGHAQESTQVGSMFYEGCVEDEISTRSIISLDTTLDETIEEIKFTIEGYNYVTNESYVLESNAYDCTGFVKDNANVQQIDIDTTRGFQMVAGLEKNAVQVFRDPLNDIGSLKAYKGIYSFRLRWEDWISKITVPSVFYDNTLLNNNLNNDWSTKDDLANWKLTYNVNMKVLRQGLEVNTKNSFDFAVRKYEESIIYDGAITTYDSTKTNSLFLGFDANGVRNNAILSAENTWIEADFDLEDLLGDVGDINDYYGVIRIEEYRNGGLFKIEMLSSILSNTENILIPLTGETQAKMTKVSDTKIRVEGLIDKTKLNLNNSQYKISARLGCKDINLGKYSGKYSQKYN